MKYFSTKRASPEVNAQKAIFQGLPEDNGLYVPEFLPRLGKDFFDSASAMSIVEIGFTVADAFFGDEIPQKELKKIVENALNFGVEIPEISPGLHCLELFHGPSLAFKDFGARFMAGIMSYFLQKTKSNLHILVATSGDTGGAVAQGFFGFSNIHVHILYPSGKVSAIQEKQLTTLGGNIQAIEVNGTFDDCQALVKKAFLDESLRTEYHLASANSINIARLIPQSFYYIYAWSRLKGDKEVIFSVPSGNFGNLTAGIIAHKMGMPVKKFLAVTNSNNSVPIYLKTGDFKPISPSITTISNAMDVGNPSNFPRLTHFFDNDFEGLNNMVKGFWYSDEETRESMAEIYKKHNYIACPHTALAYRALKEYSPSKDVTGVFLSTAHWAKFLPDVSNVLGFEPTLPEAFNGLLEKKKHRKTMDVTYADFKNYLKAQPS